MWGGGGCRPNSFIKDPPFSDTVAAGFQKSRLPLSSHLIMCPCVHLHTLMHFVATDKYHTMDYACPKINKYTMPSLITDLRVVSK